MNIRRTTSLATLALALWVLTGGVASASGGTWGQAEAVPGLAVISPGDAAFNSISCASPGNCGAGGTYTGTDRKTHGYLVNQVDGAWGQAENVSGLGKRTSRVVSVSCGSAGNCSATGSYTDSSHHWQGFVVNETGGTWGNAEEVPGLGALNKSNAQMLAVSCASAGNCSAAGFYMDSIQSQQAVVVTETGGTWGDAEEVPGSAVLNQVGDAEIDSVSCASAGNCSAGGSYEDSSLAQQAMIVTETGGAWGDAEEVPGTAVLNHGKSAAVTAVSCASAGNCTAGGYYVTRHQTGIQHAFVVDETGGVWSTAQELVIAHHQNKEALLTTLSCASAGNCTAGGRYTGATPPGYDQPFLANETDGTWGEAERVAGTARGFFATVDSVSCPAVGACSAGGYSTPGEHGSTRAFVVDENGGTWGAAQPVPGIAALGHVSSIAALSCASAGACSAGGEYGAIKHRQNFVVSES